MNSLPTATPTPSMAHGREVIRGCKGVGVTEGEVWGRSGSGVGASHWPQLPHPTRPASLHDQGAQAPSFSPPSRPCSPIPT